MSPVQFSGYFAYVVPKGYETAIGKAHGCPVLVGQEPVKNNRTLEVVACQPEHDELVLRNLKNDSNVEMVEEFPGDHPVEDNAFFRWARIVNDQYNADNYF